MLWLICYDIENDKARLRAAQAILRYGERVQRSVYECHLTMRELEGLQRELEGIIDRAADRVRFYPQCKNDQAAVRVEGGGPEVTQDERYRMV